MFTRKAPYHYGWDWGPRFVTSGIWRPVAIEAWDEARLDDVQVYPARRSTTRARGWRSPRSSWRRGAGRARVAVGLVGGGATLGIADKALVRGRNEIRLEVAIDKPRALVAERARRAEALHAGDDAGDRRRRARAAADARRAAHAGGGAAGTTPTARASPSWSTACPSS